MALIGHISVLLTALPRNKNFAYLLNKCLSLFSSSDAEDGCVAYCFLAPYIIGALG